MTPTRSHWRAIGRAIGHPIGALAICVGIAAAHATAGAQGKPDSASVVSDSVGTRDSEGRVEDGARTLGLSLMPGALGVVGSHLYALVSEESDDIRSAIDLSVAHMNFIIRP